MTTVHLRVLYGPHNKHNYFLYNINRFVFINETKNVYCAYKFRSLFVLRDNYVFYVHTLSTTLKYAYPYTNTILKCLNPQATHNPDMPISAHYVKS
jgi:hypothetical protein